MRSVKKKKGFSPLKNDLKRTLKHALAKLSQKMIDIIVKKSTKISKKHYRELYRSEPSKWKFYSGVEWLTYGIKEILNVQAGRPIEDYRAGMLTLSELRQLAEIIGIKYSELDGVNRSVWWSQIVAKVKQDEDSRINRLKKLWQWLEERIDVTDVDYLMVHAPGYWGSRECYKDEDWRNEHLSNIYEISWVIQEVVDAILKADDRTPVSTGLSRLQLWLITQKVMKLEMSNNATKEAMWQKILEKIESDKLKA